MLTTPQLLSFAVIAVMMAAFVWGRLRYDLVAALALLAGCRRRASCPLDEAFSGFSDDIVIIVGSALLVSAGVARSGIMELAHPALSRPTSTPYARSSPCWSSSSPCCRPSSRTSARWRS